MQKTVVAHPDSAAYCSKHVPLICLIDDEENPLRLHLGSMTNAEWSVAGVGLAETADLTCQERVEWV